MIRRIIFFLILATNLFAEDKDRFAELSIRIALESVSKDILKKIDINEEPVLVDLTKTTLINAIPKFSENLIFNNVTKTDVSLNVLSTISNEVMTQILPENQNITISSSADSVKASYTIKF